MDSTDRYDGASARYAPKASPQGVLAFPATATLIGVNAAVLMLEEAWGGSTSTDTLVRMGAVVSAQPEIFRWASVLTYAYLHIGLLHIAFNMWALWNLGRALEPMLGAARFFVLYTLSAVGGGVAIALRGQVGVTAGASGAIFGLLGAIVVLMARRYRETRSTDERAAIRSTIGRLLVPNIIISLLPGISFMGHAGGLLVGGASMTATLLLARDPSGRARRNQWMAGVAGVLVVATVAAIASVWLEYQPWQ